MHRWVADSHHQAERDVRPKDGQRSHVAHGGSEMCKLQLAMGCARPLAPLQPERCARLPAGVPDGMNVVECGALGQRRTVGPLQLGWELGAPAS